MWMLSASSRSRCVSARTLEMVPASGCGARPSTGAAPGEWSGVLFDLGLAFGLGPGLRSFLLGPLGLLGLAADRIDERLQAIAIFLPALHRRLVDRLANLRDAGGLHRPVG